MNRKRNRRSNRKETQPKPKTRNPKPIPGPTSGSPARTHLSCGPIFLLFPGWPILLFSFPLRPTLAPHRAGPVPQRPLSRVALHYAWPTCQRWAHPSAAAPRHQAHASAPASHPALAGPACQRAPASPQSARASPSSLTGRPHCQARLPPRATTAEHLAGDLARAPRGTDAQDPSPFLLNRPEIPLHPSTPRAAPQP